MRQARERLEPEFLLLDGHCWFDINLLDLAMRLARQPSALGAMALHRVADTARRGAVTLAGDKVLGFTEPATRPAPGLVTGGDGR